MAQHVRDQWDAGSTKHPKDAAARLAGNSNLTKSRRNLGVDLTATGIQYCSHREEQLETALHNVVNVVNDPDAQDDLKQEAPQALKQVKKYAGGPTNAIRTPYSVHENINPPSEKNTARKQNEKTTNLESEDANNKDCLLNLNMKTALFFVLGITLSSTLFSQDTVNPNEPMMGQVVSDVGSAENELEALKYLNAKIYEFVLQKDIYLVDPASGETVGFLKAGSVLASPSAVDLRDTDLGNSERLKLLIKVSDTPEVPIFIMREAQGKPMVYDARKEINRNEDKGNGVKRGSDDKVSHK